MIHFVGAIFMTLVCVHYTAHYSNSMALPFINVCFMIMSATMFIMDKNAETDILKFAASARTAIQKHYIDAQASKSKETQTSDKCVSEHDETPSASSENDQDDMYRQDSPRKTCTAAAIADAEMPNHE